jgi:uncharacterized repeat protein (TIGR03803 family)
MRAIIVGSSIVGIAALAACTHVAGSSSSPAGFVPSLAARANAGAFKSLYSFKGLPDGMSPAAGMVALNGTLYGTTQVGGQGAAGTVFATSPAGKERVLYSFGSRGPDGVFPVAGLVVLAGTFYETASAGGDHGFGAVFKVDKSGNERVLYSFKGGSDGADPYAPLVVDKGALSGTTLVGGGSTTCAQGCGTVFEVTTAGKEHVLHHFKGGNDGAGPLAGLILVGSELYGTTADGGKNGDGTIFKTSTSGKEVVLYSFKGDDDGGEPEAGLLDVGGKLYGTTNAAGKNGDGTVFVTTTAGAVRALYSFRGGSDGANPEANLIAFKGELYGTTAGGGTPNLGTVFAASTSGNEHVVHAFRTTSEGSDPRAPLTVLNGALYGTTSLGGASSVGTIFKTSP